MRDLRSSLSLIEEGDLVLELDDVKTHLRVESDDDDDYIDSLISSAQSYLDGRDGILGRALLTQRWKFSLESFQDWRFCRDQFSHPTVRDGRYFGEIKLPLPPLKSVESVQYLDTTETLQTVDPMTYRIIDGGGFASSIITKHGSCWPSTANAPDAVQISFTAGYDDVESFVAERKGVAHAMLLLIGHWFQSREGVTDGRINQPFEVPFAIERLLAPHRVSWL